MKRRLQPVLTGLIAGAIALVPSVAMAADDVIEASPSRVSIAVPGPGHSETWDMSATNLTDFELPVSLRIAGESDRLFGGPHPLELELTDPRTGDVVYSGPAGDSLGTAVEVPSLPARGDYLLTGRLTLPRDAGNEYQSASAHMVFEFRVIGDDAPQDPTEIPSTGVDVLFWALLASVGVTTGIAVALHGRKRTS